MAIEERSEFYSNGMLKSRGKYNIESNLKTGNWINYFSSGEIESEGAYINGKKDGEWFYYQQNGGIKCVKVYKDGVVRNLVRNSKKEEE